jgi:hypothetical protein
VPFRGLGDARGTAAVRLPFKDSFANGQIAGVQDFSFDFAGLNADFNSVTSGIVRIEATVGFSRLTFARFLATTDTSNRDEVTSLVATLAGNIEEEFSHTAIGTYSPNQPFRVRMDIDMTAKTWSASVDNELNGFADDPLISDLPFANLPSLISGVGELTAYLQVQDGLGTASVAFDDLTASIPGTPPTPADLLADLLADVNGVGPGTSLADKVAEAQGLPGEQRCGEHLLEAQRFHTSSGGAVREDDSDSDRDRADLRRRTDQDSISC